MSRAPSKLIWRDPGPPAFTVHGEGTRRSLEFGHGTVQTRVDLDAPHRLQLAYTRALAASLLFAGQPRSALLLGLGGGALAHFLRHHFPDLALHAVESSAAVIEAARRFFALPAEPGLRVEHADARAVLRRRRPEHDLVVVDIFDAEGLPDWVCEPAFYRDARAAMRPRGVLAVNLWVDAADEFLDVMRGAREAFDGRVLALVVRDYRNLVVLALPDAPRRIAIAPLHERARTLGERLGMDMGALVESLRTSNLTEHGALVMVADGARR